MEESSGRLVRVTMAYTGTSVKVMRALRVSRGSQDAASSKSSLQDS